MQKEGVVCIYEEGLIPYFKLHLIDDFGIRVDVCLTISFSFSDEQVNGSPYFHLIEKEKKLPAKGKFGIC